MSAESIERAALEQLHAAATPDVARQLGLANLDIGSALVSIASELPASAIVINRSVGLGMQQPASRAIVDEMLAAYRDAGVARFFVHVHPDAQPPEHTRWLVDAGLEKTRGWQKFHRGPEPIDAPSVDLRIERIGPDHHAAFGRIVCDAFDLGDAAIPWLAGLPSTEHWHVFMSFAGDEPAGTGAMFIRDGVAWMDFGATAPAYRRRGSQSALLAHRIQHAIDAGCRDLYTCTGEDVAGDPQHSYRNITRAGFEEDVLRENYAPPNR